MSKSYIGAVLRGAIGLAVAAALTLPVRAETLADALAAAYVNSGLIQQNRALLRAADEDVVIAASKLRPILQWSSSVKRSLSSGRIGSNGVYQSSDSTSTVASAGLVAELLIYDFGASKLAVQVKKEAVLGTRQKLLSVEQKVLIRAVEAFTNVRRDTEKVALRRSNLSLITEELRAAKDRFDVGEVTRTDVALAEARLAGSRSALAAAEGTLRVAVEEYRAAIGHAPKALNGSDKVLKPVKNLDAAKAIAVRQHPDIKELQHSVTVAELTLQQAQLAKKPIVKLSGSYGLTETLTSRAYGRSGEIKLQATGSIYQGGQIPAFVRQSAARRDAARYGLNLAALAVEQNVATAYARLQVATAEKEASELQIRAARVAFLGVREEAALGARTTLDVLNAEQELLDAENNKVSALADQQIASYKLRSSMGRMTADFLGLDVPKYDPEEYFSLQENAPAVSEQGKKLDRLLKSLGKK